MTDRDKLFLAALEDLRPDQVSLLLHLSKTQDRKIGQLIVDALRLHLERMNWHEREQTIQIFREGGIDLNQIL